MRLLTDACIAAGVMTALEKDGHDVAVVPPTVPADDDEEVLARAVREERVLVTADKDLGELVFHRALPAAGVILLRGLRPSQQAAAVSDTVRECADDLAAGAHVVVEPARRRIRRPPGT